MTDETDETDYNKTGVRRPAEFSISTPAEKFGSFSVRVEVLQKLIDEAKETGSPSIRFEIREEK